MAITDYMARQLLKHHGTIVNLVKVNEGNYDVSSGTLTSGTSSSYPVKAYVGKYTPDQIDNQNILGGDARLIMSPVLEDGNATPAVDSTDKITGFGDTKRVVSATTVLSGSNVLFYILQVRE